LLKSCNPILLIVGRCAGILGLMQIIADEVPASLQDDVKTVQAIGSHMLSLVSDLLDISVCCAVASLCVLTNRFRSPWRSASLFRSAPR
jgi:hypothetical protein